MVMSLKNNINIIFIKKWCQLRAENHTIGIRMIFGSSINILMESYYTPFCIWVRRNCFTDHIFMGCTVIIIRIKNNKQYVSIRIVVICSCSCYSLPISS